MNNVPTNETLARVKQSQDDQKIAKEFKKSQSIKKNQENEVTNKLTIPNHTTFMEASEKPDKRVAKEDEFKPVAFSILQLKVIGFVIKQLQPYIRTQLEAAKLFSDKPDNKNHYNLMAVQADMFKEVDGMFYLQLPKKVFVKANNYKFFRDEVEMLASLRITFRRRNPDTNKIARYTTSLFSIYEDVNAERKRNPFITIEITRPVLEHLCTISIARAGEKIQWDSDYYNTLIWEVIIRSTRRYTGLLYWYLCAWRTRGGWSVKYTDLRKLLGITTEYTRVSLFEKYVLKPSSEELRALALDFWFEAKVEGDYVHFKIITPRSLRMAKESQDALMARLRSAQIQSEDIKKLWHILSEPKYGDKIQEILTTCITEWVHRKSTTDPINNISHYFSASLQKWYQNREKYESRKK